MTLCDLEKNQLAVITEFKSTKPELITRLREIGFAEGDHVEAMHFGLFGRNPMTVRLNGALIALRRRDANAIHVSRLTKARASE